MGTIIIDLFNIFGKYVINKIVFLKSKYMVFNEIKICWFLFDVIFYCSSAVSWRIFSFYMNRCNVV